MKYVCETYGVLNVLCVYIIVLLIVLSKFSGMDELYEKDSFL